MSEDGDIDVESAEDVPDIGVEATATTTNANGDIYSVGGSHDKRAHHNALERRRRDHIKDSFHSLRDCIPSLVGEKVSRAHILNKATEYIRHMQKGGSTREDDICDLARKNEILEEQVRALEEAKLCGGVVNAEDVLQNVASRVQARQAQEMLQQLQAKNSSKISKQIPSNKSSPKTSSSAPGNTEKSVPKTMTTTEKSTGTDTPPTTSAQLNINNLLASNLKNTQSLLTVLQKNLNPNSNLPPDFKTLAARVLASPLVRGARGVQKTSQASSIPRGIVTVTTVPKGSNLSSPAIATSKQQPASVQATGTSSNVQQLAGPPQLTSGVTTTLIETAEKKSQKTEQDVVSEQEVSTTLLPSSVAGPLVSPQTSPLLVSSGSSPQMAVGQTAPSLLTSQLLEAHNLLQQQGNMIGVGTAPVTESGMTVTQGGGLESSNVPNTSSPLGLVGGQGLNISPELLAQVSSFLNLPAPPVSLASLSTAISDSCLSPQETPSKLLPSQDTPTIAPPTSINSNNSIKRSAPGDKLDSDPPLAKKPYLDQ